MAGDTRRAVRGSGPYEAADPLICEQMRIVCVRLSYARYFSRKGEAA